MWLCIVRLPISQAWLRLRHCMLFICALLRSQGQANKWVKNMETQNGLRVLNLAMPDLLRQMENAIQFGNPVLLQVSHAQHTLCAVPTPNLPSHPMFSASMVVRTVGSERLWRCTILCVLAKHLSVLLPWGCPTSAW